MIRCILSVALVIAICLPSISIAAEPQVAHMVYFKLNESSDAAKEKLMAACRKYLSEHEGTVYFSVGVLAQDLSREVNDKDFDVSLNVVFRNKAAHDKYQTHPRHLQFIEENKDLWSGVRVFDSYIPAAEGKDQAAAKIYLPDLAASFAGMISGKVVAKRDGQIVVAVDAVAKQWEHSRAKKAEAMVGKNVVVDGTANDRIHKFVTSLKVGEAVTLDVAHKRGEVLTILELTEEQRERVK